MVGRYFRLCWMFLALCLLSCYKYLLLLLLILVHSAVTPSKTQVTLIRTIEIERRAPLDFSSRQYQAHPGSSHCLLSTSEPHTLLSSSSRCPTVQQSAPTPSAGPGSMKSPQSSPQQHPPASQASKYSSKTSSTSPPPSPAAQHPTTNS